MLQSVARHGGRQLLLKLNVPKMFFRGKVAKGVPFRYL